MKRVLVCIVILVGLLAALPTFAGNNILSGIITGNHRLADNSFDVGCAPYFTTSPYYYESYTMTVTESGDYDFSANPQNPGTFVAFLGIFSLGGFDVNNQLANCIDGDNGGTLTLAAGTYTLIVTTLVPDTTGLFSVALNGPGNITITLDGTSECPNPLPANATIHSIPAGAPMFYQPDFGAQMTSNLSPGTWYTYGTSGDFTHVWIACQANSVWVPTNAVIP